MDKISRSHSQVARVDKPVCRLSSMAKLLFAASIILMSGGCATNQRAMLPSIPSEPMVEVLDGQFVWIDLMTEDIAAATSFYSQLFGWRAVKSKQNSNYYLFYHHDKPIAGMVETDNQDPSKPESLWILSMYAQNVDRTLATVTAQGGKVLEGPMDVEGRGRMALIIDSAGAPIVLLDVPGDGPKQRSAETGDWVWSDLFTMNRDQAMDFYGRLVGYKAERIEVGKTHTYELLKRDGRIFAGMVDLQWEGLKDNWLPYFKIENIDQTIEYARTLGGHLILTNGDVAVLTDPTGSAFGIQM